MQRDFAAMARHRLGQGGEQFQALAKMALGLDMGRTLHRALAGLEPAIDRLLDAACLGVVVGEQLGLGDFGKLRFEDIGDARVMALAPAFQHRLIGRVLDERVLKLVGHAPRNGAPVNELRGDEAAQRHLHGRLVERHDCGQHVLAEGAPQHRRNLRHLLDRPEVIEARHQRILDRRRDGDRRRRVRCAAGRCACFQHGLRHFLDEQRYPVRPHNNLGDDLGR